MQIFSRGKINPEIAHFKGENYMEILANNQQYDHGVANVTFMPGSRTDWHAHHFDQVLLILSGRGWLQIQDQPTQLLQAGDSVTIPADVWHWHGATDDSEFVHIAVGADPNPSATEWGNPVDLV